MRLYALRLGRANRQWSGRHVSCVFRQVDEVVCRRMEGGAMRPDQRYWVSIGPPWPSRAGRVVGHGEG